MNIHARPCDLAGFHGTALERLLFDVRMVREATKDIETEAGPGSAAASIQRRRRGSGVYT